MDQLILLPSVLLHENNQLVQDDLAALSWPGCSGFNGGGRSSFCGNRVTFTANGTFYVCVNDNGMSDLSSNQNQRAAGGTSRPSSAQLNKERHERIVLLKEKQDHDRLRKLEELKEQALAASKLREEQEERRKGHFAELVKKEDDRRKQAEERRRMLDAERKLALQAKWDKKTSPIQIRPQSSRPTFAFGSCTPRLIDNPVEQPSAGLWKSQYNLNVTREPGIRANSEQNLHKSQVRMSASMYDWNQQRTTMDNPLVHHRERRTCNGSDRRQKSRSCYDGADAMRMFCGRRKTDLTPTIPIKREAYDMSASMMSTRSTSSRGSGRAVYSSVSMTRLDRSRSPGGFFPPAVIQHQHHVNGQRPSRSKSTTHLASTGLKLTRTEILRQALAAKKDSSGLPSRPPSAMSSSIMTSSTHSNFSQVQTRPRNITKKSRPASVHVTGVSSEPPPEMNGLKSTHLRRRVDTSQERKSTPIAPVKKIEPKRLPLTSGKMSPGPTAPSPVTSGETGTIKRPIKRTPSAPKEKKASTPTSDVNVTNPFASDLLENKLDNVNEIERVTPRQENVEVRNNSKNESNRVVEVGNEKVIENFESIESAFASGSDYSKTPEPIVAPMTINTSAMDDLFGMDFSNGAAGDVHLVPENPSSTISKEVPEESNEDVTDSKPKIMTEEQAKVAIAEKRRLAREAAERETARLLEEQRLEEEKQRLEAEEADRLARETRLAEEERLRIAIEEQQKREEEEKVRKEEEELLRVEKEKQDRDAAVNAERVRLEMEERLKREEEERLERRKRVEAIMARTRKKEAEQQAKANTAEVNNQGAEPVNGHKENNVLLEDNNVQSSNNSLNNNYNNNNNSTLIEFDGMMLGGQESVNNTSTSNNPLINNPLQDLLS